ncbi:uncharacterized protein C8Q71DRAFT_682204, partial [Rhodofomes roseus]
LVRQYDRTTDRLSDYERFKGLIASGDVEGADRVVRVAINNHRSVSEICNRMVRATLGLYNVKSFTRKHYDLMRLTGALGGPKLQFAVADALQLPAISTTRTHSLVLLIEACIGFPILAEFLHNLGALDSAGVLWESRSSESQTVSRQRRRGFQIMVDELALEERPRYDGRRDAVLGMARETAHEVDLGVLTLENLEAAADALEDGSLAVAKEATMMGLAAFGYDDYTAFPIMISGTNKTERDVKQAEWIHLAIDAWESGKPAESEQTYEERYGELWCVGSDGDATRRRALHRVLMAERLSPNTMGALYRLLSSLHRMNMQCGSKGRTMTIDYKHKFKNFATLLRGTAGVLVADYHVTPVLLRQKLTAVLGYKDSKLTSLFDHKDHQNVPVAVALLQSLKSLAKADNFAQEVENRPLVLLGTFAGYLVEPFITPTLSLSEQLTMLSAAAHLLCLLYRRNRTSFCPGQWYYDVQTFIKNIFWTTAKMKTL